MIYSASPDSSTDVYPIERISHNQSNSSNRVSQEAPPKPSPATTWINGVAVPQSFTNDQITTTKNEDGSTTLTNEEDGESITIHADGRITEFLDDEGFEIDYEEPRGQYTQLAKPILDFIAKNSAVRAPGHVKDFVTHKAFWRQRFGQMHDMLVEFDGSEMLIMDPPLELLETEIVDSAMEKMCPCCMHGGDVHVVIRAGKGITQGIFLKAIRDYLYGEDVAKEELALSEKYRDGRLVVRSWDYMLHGDEYKQFMREAGSEELKIWMYCDGS